MIKYVLVYLPACLCAGALVWFGYKVPSVTHRSNSHAHFALMSSLKNECLSIGQS